MADAHKNFSKGTLTNSPGTAGTSFILGSGEGALFAANMPVTIVADQTQPDSTNAEIGYVTAVSTDTLTVTRAQQSTTALNAVAGWLVLGTITAKALTDIEGDLSTHIADTSTHGTTGAIVGTTDSQTLTNKTLTSPVINTPTGIVKGDVGLGNVDNTSDATKNAATAALTNKDLTSGTNTFPTFNQSTTGSAATLTTGRTVQTNLASTSSATFDGSANITPGVTGTLPVANGGTGASSVTAGRVVIGGSGGTAFTTDSGLNYAGGALTLGVTGGVTPGSVVMAGSSSGTQTLQPAGAASGTVTIPAGTDTLVSLTGTQTLTNKTLTAPKLGSAGFIADANGNEILKTVSTVADAINELTISNAGMLDGPTISATGDDTNIDLVLLPKGTGTVAIPTGHGITITGSAGTPTTPGLGEGKFDMAGTGATRPRFINSSGTVETVLTTETNFAAWTAWTPTFTSNVGTPTTVTVNKARFIQVGKLIHFRLDATVTNKGTATGHFEFTLPVTALDTSAALTGLEIAATGYAMSAWVKTTTKGALAKYDATTAWNNTWQILVNGTYEAA